MHAPIRSSKKGGTFSILHLFESPVYFTALPFSNTRSALFKMPSTFNKDKPWDTPDVDKWKVGLLSSHGTQAQSN
jgi:hypothetical protein